MSLGRVVNSQPITCQGRDGCKQATFDERASDWSTMDTVPWRLAGSESLGFAFLAFAHHHGGDLEKEVVLSLSE